MIDGASSAPVTIRPASIGTSRPHPEALPRVPRRARLRPEDFLGVRLYSQMLGLRADPITVDGQEEPYRTMSTVDGA